MDAELKIKEGAEVLSCIDKELLEQIVNSLEIVITEELCCNSGDKNSCSTPNADCGCSK